MADQDEGELAVQAFRVMRAIAETGSITAAAAALGYSQPAVSQQVRRIESRVGMPVVERVGRRVRLTEAGAVLARHADAVARSIDAASDELAQLRGLASGRVRLTGFPSASPTLVPRVLAALSDKAPGLAVTYVEAEPPEAMAAVREDRADIALTFSYPGDENDPHGESARGLVVRTLGADRMFVVVPDGHDLVGASVVQLGELADASWIAGCPRCRGHLLELCARAGFTPRIAFETDNIVAVENLVARGTGVATLPGLALDSFPLLPGVRAVPLPPGEQRTLHVVTAADAHRVPALRLALAAVGEAAQAAGVGRGTAGRRG